MLRCVANVAGEWTPHKHADTVSAGVRLKAKPRSCFPCTFFPLCSVCLEMVGGRRGKRAGCGNGPHWSEERLVRTAGPPLLFLSVPVRALRRGEMEGGETESMLETCAVVPDPPCRCTDSTGSVWARDAAGTQRLDLFTNPYNTTVIPAESDYIYFVLCTFLPFIISISIIDNIFHSDIKSCSWKYWQ